MAAGDELVGFVRDALGRGVSRPHIEEALRKGGWTADQTIANAQIAPPLRLRISVGIEIDGELNTRPFAAKGNELQVDENAIVPVEMGLDERLRHRAA